MRGNIYNEDEIELNEFLVDEIYQNKNKIMKKTPWYISSANPEALSMTIKGALLMYVPFILALLANFHIVITNTALVQIITDVSFATAGLMLIGGILRKVYYWFKK